MCSVLSDGPETGSCWNCRHYIEVIDTRRRDRGMYMVLGICAADHDEDGDGSGWLVTDDVEKCGRWVDYAEPRASKLD